MLESQEWVEVGPEEAVFSVPKHDRIVVVMIRDGFFGSEVRLMNGKWMIERRTMSLLDSELILEKANAGDFVRGKDLPSS